MDFFNNTFALYDGSGILLSKLSALSISTIGQCSVIKFNELSANRLLMLKKRINAINYVRESATTKSPLELISFFCASLVSVDEIYCSSKSFKQPFKDWCFRVITGQMDLVAVSPVSAFVFRNTKATFGIDKTSKKSEIFKSRSNGRSITLKQFFLFSANKIVSVFSSFHLVNKIYSISMFLGFCKSEKDSCFVSPFDKKWKKLFNKLNAANFPFMESMTRFMCWMFRRDFCEDYITSKRFFEPIKNVLVCRGDYRLSRKLFLLFSYIKTTITIKVARSVSNIGIFYHASIVAL